MTTVISCTVHSVLQLLPKIIFTEVTGNVLFAVAQLPMSISGNGTETNQTIYGTILWSVPAVKNRRNRTNFLGGMAHQEMFLGIVMLALSAGLP